MKITLEHYQIDLEDYIYLDFMENPVVVDTDFLERITKRTWALGAKGLWVGPFFEKRECKIKYIPLETSCLKAKDTLSYLVMEESCFQKKNAKREHIGTMILFDWLLL